MGIIKDAIALLGIGGVGQRDRLPDRPCNAEGEPKSTVLVIDDDPLVLLTVKTLLAKRGFEVLSTSSSPRGLDVLRCAARDIRLVVLDYSMPKINGDELLKFIRLLSPNAKVIGLTGINLDSLPREYIDGVDKLLTKPVIAFELLGAVDGLLGEGQSTPSAIQS